MFYLFLDIDGVLHPDNSPPQKTLCYAGNLAGVLRDVDPLGRIRIVISSTWRVKFSIEQLKAMLPSEISERLVGVTPDHIERPGPYVRQREIEEWLACNAPGERWMAVDDWSMIFDKACPNLFLVPGFEADDGGGLTEGVSLHLKKRLAVELNGPVSG